MKDYAVLLRRQGHVIPKDVIERVAKEFSGCFGQAEVLPDTDRVDILRMVDGVDSPDNLHKDMVEAKDRNDTVYYFANSTAKVGETEISPFPVIADGDEVEIAMVLGGDFTGYANPNSYTPEFNAITSYYKPKFQKNYDKFEQVLEDFREDLQDEVSKKDMMSTTSSGILVMICSDGKVDYWHGDDDPKVKTFPWGVGYLSTGWEVKSYPEKPVVEDKPLTARERMEARKAASATAAKETPAPVAAPVKDTAVKPPADTTEYYQCPPDINGKENIKKAYKATAGFVPPNAKDKPKVAIRKDLLNVSKNFQEAAAKLSTPPPTQTTPKVPLPDALGVLIPVIPMGSRKKAENLFFERVSVQKAVSDAGKEIITPEILKSLEAPIAPISEQLGRPLMQVSRVAYPDWIILCKECPDVAAGYLIEFKMQYMTLLAAKQAVDSKAATG